MKVGVVGGSISFGVGAVGDRGYFDLFCDWLRSVSKQPVSCRNGAIAATLTEYMVLCHRYSVDPDVDLVFVEYNMNDGLLDQIRSNRIPMATERLLRVLLGLPGRPAVVLVQSAMITPTDLREYFVTGEFVAASNPVYYDVPTLSPHTAMFSLTSRDQLPGWSFNQTISHSHPGDNGHRLYTDLIVHLLQEAALDVIHRPLTAAEQREARSGLLPRPMHPGNVPPASSACMVGQDFTELVESASGFTWLDEGHPGRPKLGYVATAPGSTLAFRIDTRRPSLPANASVSVFLYYLGSYTPMGTARVECVGGGCGCAATEVDAHISERVSQTYMVSVDMSQAANCRVRVTVLDKSSSGGHKFKVVGVVVTEQQSSTAVLKPFELTMGLIHRNPGVDFFD